MYKFILDLVYPSAPKPATSTEAVKTAIIEALVGHLYRLGYSVKEVRVPASLVPGEPPLFVSSYGELRVVAGLDAYGDNVVTSALNGNNVTNDNTASATVSADTVPTKYLIEKSADVEPVLSALTKLDEAAEGGSPALTEEEFRALGRVRVLNEAGSATVTMSDDDLVKLIALTVMGVRDRNGLYPADRAFKIASAVFDVLRAEGSVR